MRLRRRRPIPRGPITIVSAQAPGGASDTIARMVGDRLQAALGQPIVIDSRPGASGNVGAAFVARAAPDGYTLMIGTDAMMTSNVHLFKGMTFDPAKDFAPITNAGANIIVPGRAHVSAGEFRGRADRPRQGQSRQAAVRLFGHRLAASPRRRTAQAEGRYRHRPRALSGRRAVGKRSRRRAYRDGVPELFGRGAAASQPARSRCSAVVEKTRYAAIPEVPTIGRYRAGIRNVVLARRSSRRPARRRRSCAPQRGVGEDPQGPMRSRSGSAPWGFL